MVTSGTISQFSWRISGKLGTTGHQTKNKSCPCRTNEIMFQYRHFNGNKGVLIYCFECDYRRVLDWWSHLFYFLIQRVTTLYSSLLHTQIHTHTQTHTTVFSSRCSVAASNSGQPPSSGFPNYVRPQLPASHSNSSQRLHISSSLTHSLTNQLLFTSLNSARLHFTYWLAYNISARIAKRAPFLGCCIQLLPWEHACLRSRYLVMAVVYFVISRSLRRNGYKCHNIYAVCSTDKRHFCHSR
jgi:hypothetical protein